MYGRPMTVKECADQAERAIKSGRLDEGQWLLDRAKAIKAGPDALRRFERTADAAQYASDTVKAIRAERQQDARLNVAMVKAIKAEALAEIDPDAVKLANELHGGNYAHLAYVKHRAYAKYLKSGIVEDGLEKAVVLSPGQLLEAVTSGLSAAEVKATMQEAQQSLGGFLVAETVREEVLGRAATLTVVRSRATIDTPSASGGLGFPVWQGSGDVYPSALRGVWSAEVYDSAEENPVLGIVKPPINLWRVKVYATKTLLEDAGARLVNSLSRLFAETMAAAEDAAELVGSGAGQPLGLLAQQAAGVLSNPNIRVTNSGHATAIMADGIINMLYSLPGQYRNAPGFAVTCNAATLKAIRLLKDSAGRYLYNEGDHTLCGYTLAESESMPDIAANAFPIACGDFAGYYIADRLGLSIQRFDDDTTAALDQVLFYVRRRVGGTPGEGYRFGAMRVST